MKQAVSILQPYIEASKQADGEISSNGKVLLATVKGDVHDIGKNIVAVVMACNGYEVIDLGVMAPAETIVQRALEEKVDIIGLSGLITPSLDEMVNVARELQRVGANIPLMIGGATTSKLHTALKIAPVYDAPVIWVKDASQNAIVASRLLNTEESREYALQITKEYEQLRADSAKKEVRLVSLDEAREKRINLFG